MKRRIKLLAVLMCLAMALSGCAPIASNSGNSEEKGVYVLYTSDVHCGVEDGFGYAGLYAIRKSLEDHGYETILVDDGDAIQGDIIGSFTHGEAIVDIMNEAGYDVAIPGNHEFDYGMDNFFYLVNYADFPYISCNFTKNDELVLPPYKIIEKGGIKIGFVGVTTPETLTSSDPKHFQNEKGEYIYGFMEGDDGKKLYDSVQKAVDEVRSKGADYVYVMGHVGNEESCRPYTYADIIANTNGIDVFLDGHSHDTEQVVVKNKDGVDVTRSAVGTKFAYIGHSLITSEGIKDTGLWSWTNDVSAISLLGIDNKFGRAVNKKMQELEAILKQKVATSSVELTTNDPDKKDSKGQPVRLIRRSETNLGDLCADSIRIRTGADIGFQNGGGLRNNIKKGDITYEDIIDVLPFNDTICTVEATGQQILDALEWGAKKLPQEQGPFLQVSGITLEINSGIASPCVTNEQGTLIGIEGPRRVSNVRINGEPIDPNKKYIVGGATHVLLNHGGGNTAFDGAKVIQSDCGLEYFILADYIVEDLEGNISTGYENPYGQGRIVIHN